MQGGLFHRRQAGVPRGSGLASLAPHHEGVGMLRRLGQIELATCGVLPAALTGPVFVAAIMRLFGRPLIWSIDMAQLLFIWLCMLGATRAMREKSHLGMEILAKRLTGPHRLRLEIACSLITLAFLAVLIVQGFQLTLMNRERT